MKTNIKKIKKFDVHCKFYPVEPTMTIDAETVDDAEQIFQGLHYDKVIRKLKEELNDCDLYVQIKEEECA
ncbi:hypothetical protein N8Z97_00385 [Gammaproteobacteria bacterium]|jgi:hypothetical protein|nr:hypothetical protein [Gammaproteobacteria bacterium]